MEGRPEEEEEDSEDSDESDEELRCYSIQEPSEDSEEESPAVPVVVAESQSARNLRSLLKMPSLLSEAFCEDLDRKKKAVSFFDDVTVYLFDQVGGPLPQAWAWPGVHGMWVWRSGGAGLARCAVTPAGEPHSGSRGTLPRGERGPPRVPAAEQPRLAQRPQPPKAA